MVDDEDVPEGMQWWRIEYDIQVSGAKVMKTVCVKNLSWLHDANDRRWQKSTQDDVIRAAELEHNQALLVYASDGAISTHSQAGLPAALKVGPRSKIARRSGLNVI